MKTPPPPPPVPASGVEPQASSEVSPPAHDAAVEVASTPEEFAKMIGFVNEVRRIRGLGAVSALPEATGTLAGQRPLSLALGCSVMKHKDNGPFYALAYTPEVRNSLTQTGCRVVQSVKRVMSDEESMMWEVRLPEYLKPFA